MISALLFSRPKSPDVWHRDRSQLNRSLIGQMQVSQPSFHAVFMCGQSQVEVSRSFLYIEILHRVQQNIHIRRLSRTAWEGWRRGISEFFCEK